MKFFKTPNDLDGYGVEVEKADLEKPLDLPELQSAWTDILWEGAIKKGQQYHSYYLTTNSHMLEFIFPDKEWLDDDLRESLEKHRTDKRDV
jgi:hypothetical protein